MVAHPQPYLCPYAGEHSLGEEERSYIEYELKMELSELKQKLQTESSVILEEKKMEQSVLRRERWN